MMAQVPKPLSTHLGDSLGDSGRNSCLALTINAHLESKQIDGRLLFFPSFYVSVCVSLCCFQSTENKHLFKNSMKHANDKLKLVEKFVKNLSWTKYL